MAVSLMHFTFINPLYYSSFSLIFVYFSEVLNVEYVKALLNSFFVMCLQKILILLWTNAIFLFSECVQGLIIQQAHLF